MSLLYMKYKTASITTVSLLVWMRLVSSTNDWLFQNEKRTNPPAAFKKEKEHSSLQTEEPNLGPVLCSWKQFHPAFCFGVFVMVAK